MGCAEHYEAKTVIGQARTSRTLVIMGEISLQSGYAIISNFVLKCFY